MTLRKSHRISHPDDRRHCDAAEGTLRDAHKTASRPPTAVQIKEQIQVATSDEKVGLYRCSSARL